ncbi:MAG: nucleotidyltransferase family protein [Eubacteriales bacterium]|nr:nucleotidyltransferase family protein [Eubacteriales bacterium]
MPVCGIISEYNPFHSGHAHHCRRIRDTLPDAILVSVMSGNYVQRGDFAIWEKYQRAGYAVQSGGPDLILELSLPSALGSAERFAAGAVAQLLATGCLTHLSFGSECGDKEKLLHAAAVMQTEEFSFRRSQKLTGGISYAAAAQAAMQELFPEGAALLGQPNDMLGIQYIRALGDAAVEILPVLRVGARHDAAPENGYPSASYLRQQMASGNDASPYLTPEAAAWPRHTIQQHESELFSYLRRLSPDDLARLPDVSEGLEHRFWRAIREQNSLHDAITACASRRYPVSRIRRLALCAWLGISAELAATPPQYLRVLAFNDKGRGLLKDMKQTASLPVITKPLAAQALTGRAEQLWSLDMLADDLYHFPQPAGSGWKQTVHRV